MLDVQCWALDVQRKKRHNMNSLTPILILLVLASLCLAATPSKEDYTRLANEVEFHLMTDVVRPWFPRCIDTETGGFHPNFSRDWTKGSPAPKFIVFQSRMTWITATLSKHRPALRDELDRKSTRLNSSHLV